MVRSHKEGVVKRSQQGAMHTTLQRQLWRDTRENRTSLAATGLWTPALSVLATTSHRISHKQRVRDPGIPRNEYMYHRRSKVPYTIRTIVYLNGQNELFDCRSRKCLLGLSFKQLFEWCDKHSAVLSKIHTYIFLTRNSSVSRSTKVLRKKLPI